MNGPQVHAFSYNVAKGFADLGTLGGGTSFAAAINNSGIVVGTSTIKGSPPDSDGLQRAFMFVDGKMDAVPGTESVFSQAVAINTSGQVAGDAQLNGESHGFVYETGKLTRIDAPSGYLGVQVVGIGDSGHIILLSTVSVNGGIATPRAFIYLAGSITAIPPLADGMFNESDGVNSKGDVVGVAAAPSGVRHAFIFSAGKVQDLNYLIGSAGADWILEEATGINTSGQIVGYGSLRGQVHAFLLSPGTPPPVVALPQIGAVVNSGDFISPVAIQGLGTVFGELLSDSPASVDALPLPRKLLNTEVFVCPEQIAVDVTQCDAAQLIYVSASQINFLAPDNVTAVVKPHIVLRVNGQLDADSTTGNARIANIAPYSPAIFFMGYDCLIDARYQNRDPTCGLTTSKNVTLSQAERGAITDNFGNLLTSANPARLGQPYTIWLTGLGKLTNGNYAGAPGMELTNIPVYSYTGDTHESYGAFDYIGPSPQFPGLQQINFVLPTNIATGDPSGYPPMWPCGDYQWEISIDFHQGDASDAHLFQVPIAVKRGDVPCVTK